MLKVWIFSLLLCCKKQLVHTSLIGEYMGIEKALISKSKLFHKLNFLFIKKLIIKTINYLWGLL